MTLETSGTASGAGIPSWRPGRLRSRETSRQLNKEDPTEGEIEFVQPLLPRGRHQLTADEVAENQRQRLVAAMAHSVATRGYAATSVDRILQGSGVSRGTFYELFGNRHDCLVAAHEASLELVADRVSAACGAERRWAAQVNAGVHAVVDFAEQMPERARLLTLDVLAADREASNRGLAAIERFAAMLRTGREHHPKAVGLPEVTERLIVGSIAMTINLRLLDGESLAGLAPEIAFFALMPYLGAAAARRATAQS